MPEQCLTDAGAAACAKVKGWPDGPMRYSGDVPPENVQTGYWVGDQYFNTDVQTLYVFNGTPGTSVGWVLINP